MSLIRLSADNPASLLAAAVLVIVFGIVGIVTLPIQMLPDIEYPQINVNTSWRNAAPQEIEANIIEPQEEALRQVTGVVELSSNISPGNGNVNLQFDVGSDLTTAVIDVLNALNNVPDTPPDANEPEIQVGGFDFPVATLLVHGVEAGDPRDVSEFQRTIDNDAARGLVAAVGKKQTELLEAIDRVVLYVGERSAITSADVGAVVAKTREADVFALTDAVGRGQHHEALSILAAMFRAGEKDASTSMRLFALLTRHMRLVFAAKFAPRGQAPAVLGLPPFIANKYLQQAGQFNEPRLRSAYAGLVRLDHDLKGGSYVAYQSPYMSLQRWILEVCQALPGVEPRR